MNAGLRALLTGIVDYAGLFPPAQLPLDQAIRNYARYRNGPEWWMLESFVVPVGRLDELSPFVQELFADGPPLALNVLTSAAEDRRRVHGFMNRHKGRACIDSFEVKAAPDADSVRAWATGWAGVWVETTWEGDWRKSVRAAVAALHGAPRAGYKLRCGGATAAAVPSAEQVSFVLSACGKAGVPLKFTAGLHHPFRRFDAGVGTAMHGFLNVFAAGVLAHARRLPASQLQAVLEDEIPSHFSFSDDGLRWGGSSATTEEVAAARRDFVASFGSCSFDEPRDDLRALGWLPSKSGQV
jgi:hypothetical protein